MKAKEVGETIIKFVSGFIRSSGDLEEPLLLQRPAKRAKVDGVDDMKGIHDNGDDNTRRPYPKPATEATDQQTSVDSVEEQPKWKLDFYLPPTPDVISLAVGQRLVAIGDIHGNSRLLTDCLLSAGIAEREDDGSWMWSGGNTICVQVGDFLDRGYQEEKCILLLTKLARQAKQAGGAVIILWGNHEMLNATGDFTCTTNDKAFEKTFGPILDEWKGNNKSEEWHEQYQKRKYAARHATFEPGGPLSGPLLSNLKVAVQVGRTVLVHAGLRVEHLQRHGGIKGMNKMARDWILGKTGDRHVFHSIGAGVKGPVWMRDYSCPANKEPGDKAASMIDDVLRELDVDRLVVGHTVQHGVNSAHEGKVWRIDISGERWHDPNDKIALQVSHDEDGNEQIAAICKK